MPNWARKLQQEIKEEKGSKEDSNPNPEKNLQAQDIVSQKKETGKKGKLYCICRKPYRRGDGDMVLCDHCKEWFHFACVGETAETISKMDIYTCPDCKPVVGLLWPTSGH